LFIAGISACFCFRQFKLSPLACVLGGLAAGLNSDFFSTACWGVASQVIGFGADYLALGLLAGAVASRHRWIKIILAGMAVAALVAVIVAAPEPPPVGPSPKVGSVVRADRVVFPDPKPEVVRQ